MTRRFRFRIGTSEALLLLRNISMTLRAGVPLARSLQLFAKEGSASRRKLVSHLAKQVEDGHPLSEAMETAPREFPGIAIQLTKTGELGGTLVENLEEVVTHLHKMQDLKRKIRSAMMYPTFVLVAITGLGLTIGMLVLPELIPLFESLDVTLPLSTRVLLVVASFFEQHGTVFTLSVLTILAAFLFAIRLETVKPYWHRVLLLIPFVGASVRESSLAQMCRTLATLLKSGIPIAEALPATAEATSNRVIRMAIQRSIPSVETGHRLADGLMRESAIPQITATLIGIGEQTGTLTTTLDYLADYYEQEVDYSVKDFTTALEPALLIGIGVIVGTAVLAIITPIYDVTSSLG